MNFWSALFGRSERKRSASAVMRLRHPMFQKDCVDALLGNLDIRGLPKNQERAALVKVVTASFEWASGRLDDE